MSASSVVSEDHQALDILIGIHAGIRSTILDCTYRDGRAWRRSTIKPTKTMDKDSSYSVDIVADYCRMPFPAESFDVIVFHPKRCEEFDLFLREAQRVCAENGIVLAKITNAVTDHKYRWNSIEFILTAQRIGFTACDAIIKLNKPNKQKSTSHAQVSHSYWLVLRNSDRCRR